MTGPASPAAEGPTFEPPQLPPGWIAQWDATTKKYYYVQLSTGASQWETPTQAAPGGTPAQGNEHPYGHPDRQEVITHPDGSQTVRHADGRMEPVLSAEASRAVDGPSGDRGIGSFATNALLNQFTSGKQSHGSNSGSGGLGVLAGSLIGGLSGSSGSHGSNSHGGGGSNPAGKLVGSLASSLFSSGKKPQPPQNYHGGQGQPQHSGGFAGSVMGGVANMFGGHQGQPNQNYGYSQTGQSGGYNGQAPPTSYQPPAAASSAYSSPHPNNQHGAPPYNGHHQSYQSPPPAPAYGGQHAHAHGQRHAYEHTPTSHDQGYQVPQQPYVSSQPTQPQYGGAAHYPPPPYYAPPSYGGAPVQSGQQSYAQQPPYPNGHDGPPVPTGTHPLHGQQSHQSHSPGGYPGKW